MLFRNLPVGGVRIGFHDAVACHGAGGDFHTGRVGCDLVHRLTDVIVRLLIG